jgi:hypothetical protein
MKKTLILSLALAPVGTGLAQRPAKQAQTDPSLQVFWDRFKSRSDSGRQSSRFEFVGASDQHALWHERR